MNGIGFGMADKFFLLQQPVDIVFTINVNEWKEVKSLQLQLIDFRPCVPAS
jgi:single-stranded-DNA-specific exonuclease